MHVYTYIYIYVCTYVYMNIYMCVCMCVCVWQPESCIYLYPLLLSPLTVPPTLIISPFPFLIRDPLSSVSDAKHAWLVVDVRGNFSDDRSMTSVFMTHQSTPTRAQQRTRRLSFSRTTEAIDSDAEEDYLRGEDLGGLTAYNEQGEKLLVFVGVIDVLQSYVLRKRVEHTWKALVHDGDKVSVHKPSFYVKRFLEFMLRTVFVPSDERGRRIDVNPLESSPRLGVQLGRPVNSQSFRRRRGVS